MMLVKANRDSEVGLLPCREVVAAIEKLNEDLAQADVWLAAEGLHARSKRARANFDGRKRTVTDGPFAETKELLAGFWLVEVESKQRGDRVSLAHSLHGRRGGRGSPGVRGVGLRARDPSSHAAAREQARREEHQKKAVKR
jgi:hypothetical protein